VAYPSPVLRKVGAFRSKAELQSELLEWYHSLRAWSIVENTHMSKAVPPVHNKSFGIRALVRWTCGTISKVAKASFNFNA